MLGCLSFSMILSSLETLVLSLTSTINFLLMTLTATFCWVGRCVASLTVAKVPFPMVLPSSSCPTIFFLILI